MGSGAAANETSTDPSKHALHGLFETLRYELKGSGGKVMLVCPGLTATDLRKNALVGDGSVAAQPPLAHRQGGLAAGCCRGHLCRGAAPPAFAGVVQRRLARFFPQLYERVLLPRLSGLKPSGRA